MKLSRPGEPGEEIPAVTRDGEHFDLRPLPLIWHRSQYLTFEPGDLLLTATPQGVALSGEFPYLAAGDVCEIEIERFGRHRQALVASRDLSQV